MQNVDSNLKLNKYQCLEEGRKNYVEKDDDDNYRIVYDVDGLKVLSIQLLAFEHPDWSYEKRKEVGSTPERLTEITEKRMIVDLQGRLMEDDYDDNSSYHFKVAKWIIENVQPELMQNINEWIEHKPISDIKIHNVSINDIMTQFENYKISFVQALSCLIYWQKTNYHNPDFCRDYFLIL